MNEAILQESDLAQGYRNTYQKAVAAVKMSNHSYAVELLLAIVKDNPSFLDGRKLLRSAAVTANSGAKKKFLDTSAMKVNKAKGTTKKDPVAAIAELEEILKEDPLNVGANTALFEAANAASMPQTAAFALEMALKGKPDDNKTAHKLANYLLAHDDPERAIKIYEHIIKHDATDGDARSGLTNANAKLSMKRQKWGEGADGGNFRDLLKNKDAAKKMEDMTRIGATAEQIHEQIAHLAPEYEANPNDINVVRKIAELYERLEDWETALSYFAWAHQLSNGDASLETKVHKLQDRIEEISIQRLRAELDAAPDAPDAEEKRHQIEQIEQARVEKLVVQSRDRVERNPTDPQLRFELGSNLYAAGHSREAIPELQRAKSNPHIRHKAMLMLARCYGAAKMYDLALGQLKEAVVEMVVMDSTKKEIVYEMGLMNEAMGSKAEALENFKQIYAVDYGYRDVAARVEGAYGG
jgi:tetratricopeptide (TPR) repeat protein